MSKSIQYTPLSEMLFCEECNAPFATHSGLRYHMKAMHSGESKYRKVQTPPVTKEQASYKTKVPVNISTAGRVVKVRQASAPAPKIKVPVNPKPLKADDIVAELVSSVDDVSQGIVYECVLCSAQEGVLVEMELHLWTSHSEHLSTPKSTNRFISCRCSACDEKLLLHFKRHVCKGTAPVTPLPHVRTPQQRRSCGACFKEVVGPWALVQHAQAAHLNHAEILYFPTELEYDSWKSSTEASSRCQFIQCGQQGSTVFYKCNLESIGLLCPSMMLVETLSNGIKVNFHKYHFGHDHQPYKIDHKYKRHHLTDFLKSSNKIDTDLYIQFKNLMDNIVLESAKLNKLNLTNIFGKALQMAFNLSDDGNKELADDEQSPEGDIADDEQSPVVDEDDYENDGLEELIVPEVLDTPVKRPLDTVIGQKVTVIGQKELEDSNKRSSVRLKKKVEIMDIKPILKTTETTPAKRLKRSVTIANDVPSEEFMPKIVKVQSEVSSPSFNDSYKNFVQENLVKDKEKMAAIKTPKVSSPKNVSKSKNVPPPKKVLPKFVPLPKKVSPKKSRTKLGQYKPRRHSEEQEKVDLTKVKIEGYEVKERENDCNILVLKI